MTTLARAALSILACSAPLLPNSQAPGPVARFAFDGNTDNRAGAGTGRMVGGRAAYVEGLAGRALAVGAGGSTAHLALDHEALPLGKDRDFSVQAWARTTVGDDQQIVLISHKQFVDNSLASQKQPGWVFYVSGGTWAWSMGSGQRRLTYLRDNGQHMPMNDGQWHQLTMTYDSARSEVRLYYDGLNQTVYHVDDGVGFDFTNTNPLVVGWHGAESGSRPDILPTIQAGAETLQAYVDAFNGLGRAPVTPEEFLDLIVDPRRLLNRKVEAAAATLGEGERAAYREAMGSVDFDPVRELESELMRNPYTVHQVANFMQVAPLMQVYALVNGKVTIREAAAREFADRERLRPPVFDMDNLAIWDRPLSPEEVLGSYAEHREPRTVELEDQLTSLTAASWNIWHGGVHWNDEEHGWDSRVAIADMIREANIDVVMMQETYSAGDFIAAELGYSFATTVDWDYLNQGANISVLSRYPIQELHVEEESVFMNVGVKVRISETQDLYVMSNWYGMQQWPAVFEFHTARFRESDATPTLFAGDFNAVPHTDGGDSPASRALLGAGFTDAFRETFPDAQQHPGPSHRSGRRIDQLYYKGAGLGNTSTEVISTRDAGFPSDHFLIISRFALDYTTPRARR